MNSVPFTLGGVEIPRGSSKRVEIPLPLFFGSPTHMHAHVIRGRKSGPTVFISAAIHGDELNGIEIIRRLRKLNLLNKIRGTIIFIPIVNIYGVMNLSRYLPDRRDLNRSFPGSSQGSLASRVAQTFYEEIVSKCDLGIDLHTASIHKTNLPQIRGNTEDPFTLKMANAFEAPVILHSELRDGSLRAVAQEDEIPILLFEAGEALRFDEQSIKIGVRGVVNVLRAYEMLPPLAKKSHKRVSIKAKRSSWIRATNSGFIRTLKQLGDVVNTGDIIAYIDEVFEDKSYQVIAPFDGIIIGKTQIPLAQEGDALFHIAVFSDLKLAEERLELFSDYFDATLIEGI